MCAYFTVLTVFAVLLSFNCFVQLFTTFNDICNNKVLIALVSACVSVLLHALAYTLVCILVARS